MQESFRPRPVLDPNALPLGGTPPGIDQAASAPRDLDRRATEEGDLAIRADRLAGVLRDEPHALLPHPEQGGLAARDEDLDQLRVAAVVVEPIDVVAILLDRIAAEVGVGDLRPGQLGHQGAQVLDAVVREAHRAGRETGIPERLFRRGAFEHANAGAVFASGQRGAERRIAGADHDHLGPIAPVERRFPRG